MGELATSDSQSLCCDFPVLRHTVALALIRNKGWVVQLNMGEGQSPSRLFLKRLNCCNDTLLLTFSFGFKPRTKTIKVRRGSSCRCSFCPGLSADSTLVGRKLVDVGSANLSRHWASNMEDRPLVRVTALNSLLGEMRERWPWWCYHTCTVYHTILCDVSRSP